ncbi:MAG: hypothetical protein AABY85_02810 [Gemmatimonadota bacterium]
MRFYAGLRFTSVGLAAALVATIHTGAGAQNRATARFEGLPPRLDAGGDPTTPDLDLRAIRRASRFRLFAQGDFSVTGGHGVGNFGTYLTNQGPCDPGQAIFSDFACWIAFGPPYAPGSWTFQFFEAPFVAGVPASEWTRALPNVPSLAAAKGGGYASLNSFTTFSGRAEIGPDDGGLGRDFAGVTSTTDGGCRDNTSSANGELQGGLPLSAQSNCPETWATSGFAGRRRISQESWQTLSASQGSSFRFDFHRVDPSLQDQTKFLGAFQTYGTMSDHYREILAAYPPVTILGGGDPNGIGGWPLGLTIFYRAYTFTLPTVASVLYYEALVINDTREIYGVGLGYDSLYFGWGPGTGGSTGGGGQRYSNYYDAARNLALYHQSGVNPARCVAARQPAGGLGCGNNPSRGYNNAGNALIWLKSPYGDARNKLFTRAGSPFYDPTNPAAGDTILFNHGHMCGFGGCWAATVNVNDRRAFGMISSTEANVLDGRTTGSLSTAEAWRTFRNRGYPTTRGIFNRWVPGGFDYNKDGIQDTLFYDTCGGPDAATMALGCVTLDADTLPSGHLNSYGNVGGVSAVGPFRLAAGDTAVFVWATLSEKDSARTFAQINSAIDFYQNFFLGPEPPPAVDIVSTQLDPAGVNRAPSATLFYTDAPERYTDAFLAKFAGDMAAAPAGTELYRLRTLNPSLVGDIQARADNNLSKLLVFKSCDGGDNFTADGDCDGDPATDQAGNPVGVGWQAYAILDPADFPAGDLPNVFTDGAVTGGRTYLYVILGESIGATFNIVDSLDTDGNGTLNAVGPRVFSIADALTNPLSRSSSDPNVALIYVPSSHQAGSVNAASNITLSEGPSTVPFEVGVADSVVVGTYTATFGTRIRLLEYRTGAGLDSTRVLVEDSVRADLSGTLVTRIVATDSGTTFNALGVPYAGTPATSVAGSVTTLTFSALGFAVFKGTEPLFVSTTLTGTSATPAAIFSRSDFPGFLVSADNRNALRFADERTIGPAGDTLTLVNVNNYSPNWRQDRQGLAKYVGGRYELTWLSEPFGLQRGLDINQTDPSVTEAELTAALRARTAGATALIDASTATLVGVAAAGLVAARVPFTIRNVTTGTPVTVAMPARASNRMLLGSGIDTIRVGIPADEWIPGDRLILIDSVIRDSTAANGGVVLSAAGLPIQVAGRRVAFDTAIVGCNSPDNCNPLRVQSPGQTGYVSLAAGTRTQWHYNVGFNRDSKFTFATSRPISGSDITSVTRAQLDSVRVVPNPFVVFSAYQTEVAESRVLFTHLPPSGTLRIYTVSGQFAQQIAWTAADLNGSGDLFYNLRTREGTDLASGLYIWYLTTTIGGRTETKRGKFVVIRGQNN